MKEKRNLGYQGEDVAVEYLMKNKYEILERNFYSIHDEIDIIAKKENEIIFIEVKTRRSLKFGNPAEAVNNIKIKHMKKAARYYLYKTKNEYANVRFDIIEVYICNDKFKINHIKQVV